MKDRSKEMGIGKGKERKGVREKDKCEKKVYNLKIGKKRNIKKQNQYVLIKHVGP